MFSIQFAAARQIYPAGKGGSGGFLIVWEILFPEDDQRQPYYRNLLTYLLLYLLSTTENPFWICPYNTLLTENIAQKDSIEK